MDKQVIQDIIRWGVVNWSKSLGFWNSKIDLKNKNYKCLELGARQGGLSLWLALQGNEVVCSDISFSIHADELQKAKDLHKKYDCQDKITCEAIDALNIPYENEFDIVIMKSTLGGVSEYREGATQEQVVAQIYKCLKPDGKVLFVENAKGSYLHRLARNILHKNKEKWNYFEQKDVIALFSDFKRIDTKTVGFLGVFGRSEGMRTLLSHIDSVIEKVLPKSLRYIIIGYVEK